MIFPNVAYKVKFSVTSINCRSHALAMSKMQPIIRHILVPYSWMTRNVTKLAGMNVIVYNSN